MYNNPFTRDNPGLVIIMIDQSGSMCLRSNYNGLMLSENAANSVNNVVNELILKLTIVDAAGEEAVKKSLKLILIGYGGPKDEAYIICNKWIDEVADAYPRGKVNVTTREGTFPQDCIIVVEAVADECTPMGWAMSVAKDEVLQWVNSHNSKDDPVPIVINISDGGPTDSYDDVRKYANEIKSLRIPDGNPQIFNIHISASSTKDIRFPKTSAGLDCDGELLFDISSEISQDLMSVVSQTLDDTVQGGEKMMMSNVADPAVLVKFLKIGTVQKLR